MSFFYKKRLKRALKPAADKCDGIAPDRTPPFPEDTQTEEIHEDAQHFHSNVEDYCQNTKVNILSYSLLLYFCVNTSYASFFKSGFSCLRPHVCPFGSMHDQSPSV